MGREAMKITLNIDAIGYTEKPKAFIGEIRNRLARGTCTITPDTLLERIKAGYTFTPAEMAGTVGDSWKQQQIIAADVDNDRNSGRKDENGKAIKEPIGKPLQPSEALQVLKQYGIDPFCIYNTFSNTSDCPKFRIVLVLTEPIKDKKQAVDYTARLAGILNAARDGCTDTKIADPARLLFGGRSDCIIYSGGTTDLSTLKALPEVQEPEQRPIKPTAQRNTTNTAQGGSIEALKLGLDAEIRSFDLAAYIAATDGGNIIKRGAKIFINPSPLCYHYDCFQVTGALWHEWSDNYKGGITGGTIIDYLMAKRDLTTGEALEVFKFEIMRYSREDWKRAYMEQQNEQRKAEEQRSTLQEQTRGADLSAADDAERAQRTGAGMVDSFLQAVQTEKYKPMPTGITDIDRALYGGFTRGQIIMLGAAPGVGKTALAQWIFEGMAQRDKVTTLYINLEMSREQILARSLARIAARQGQKIKPIEVLQGYKWTDAQRSAIEAAAQEYKDTIASFIMYNPEGISADLDTILAYIEQEAQRVEKTGQPAPCVVVDYLHLITGKKGEDAAEIIKRAMDGFKGYAIRHNSLVFMIQAHNRDSNEKGDISQGSGRDTSAIEYGADLQLGLTYTACMKRAGFEKKRPDDLTASEKKFITLRVTKTRWSEPGKEIDLHFNGETMTYTQLSNEMTETSEPAPFTGRPRKIIAEI